MYVKHTLFLQKNRKTILKAKASSSMGSFFVNQKSSIDIKIDWTKVAVSSMFAAMNSSMNMSWWWPLNLC
jgi:hypothetical protein